MRERNVIMALNVAFLSALVKHVLRGLNVKPETTGKCAHVYLHFKEMGTLFVRDVRIDIEISIGNFYAISIFFL